MTTAERLSFISVLLLCDRPGVLAGWFFRIADSRMKFRRSLAPACRILGIHRQIDHHRIFRRMSYHIRGNDAPRRLLSYCCRRGIFSSLERGFSRGFESNGHKNFGMFCQSYVCTLLRRSRPVFLLEYKGQWKIIDLIAIAEALADPVGPIEPPAAFLREVQERYAGVPSAIFPKESRDQA